MPTDEQLRTQWSDPRGKRYSLGRHKAASHGGYAADGPTRELSERQRKCLTYLQRLAGWCNARHSESRDQVTRAGLDRLGFTLFNLARDIYDGGDAACEPVEKILGDADPMTAAVPAGYLAVAAGKRGGNPLTSRETHDLAEQFERESSKATTDALANPGTPVEKTGHALSRTLRETAKTLREGKAQAEDFPSAREPVASMDATRKAAAPSSITRQLPSTPSSPSISTTIDAKAQAAREWESIDQSKWLNKAVFVAVRTAEISGQWQGRPQPSASITPTRRYMTTNAHKAPHAMSKEELKAIAKSEWDSNVTDAESGKAVRDVFHSEAAYVGWRSMDLKQPAATPN